MGSLERILLLIYFPQFRSPIKSRFESFFTSMLKNQSLLNHEIKVSEIIFPDKIARNEDKRTSIIIKGIPNDMPKNDVRNLLDKFGNINYLYLIKDPINFEKSTSIAFVNFINYKSIIPLYLNFRRLKFIKNEQIYNISIMYSAAQGKKQLIEYLKKNNFFKY